MKEEIKREELYYLIKKLNFVRVDVGKNPQFN